nr:MAG TPA: hypothetical protein [Caudoviricetes sp.]
MSGGIVCRRGRWRRPVRRGLAERLRHRLGRGHRQCADVRGVERQDRFNQSGFLRNVRQGEGDRQAYRKQ